MKKYLCLLKIEFMKIKEYGLNFLGQLISLPIQMLVIYFIWKYVYINTSSIGSYSFYDIISYYFVLYIFEIAITPIGIVTFEVWNDINQGKLNIYLSKPISYPLFIFFSKIGYFIWSIASGIIFLYVIAIFFPVVISHNIINIILTILSSFLGIVLMFTMFFIIGVLTFWLENVLTLRDNLWNIIKILSGQIFPVTFFPAAFQKISNFLPFQYIYYVPISILQNKLAGIFLYKYFISQLLWALCMSILSWILWLIGSRRYTAQGG